MGRERKETIGREARMYVYVWTQGGGMSVEEGQMDARKKSVMDAQLHTDINIDTVSPRPEMYHVHF